MLIDMPEFEGSLCDVNFLDEFIDECGYDVGDTSYYGALLGRVLAYQFNLSWIVHDNVYWLESRPDAIFFVALCPEHYVIEAFRCDIPQFFKLSNAYGRAALNIQYQSAGDTDFVLPTNCSYIEELIDYLSKGKRVKG